MKLNILLNKVKNLFSEKNMIIYFEHTERVIGYTKLILSDLCLTEEKKELIVAAAMIHDLGRVVDNGFLGHIKELNDISYTVLQECGFKKEETEYIINIAIQHHPDKDTFINSLEAQIIFDADNLDLSGSIGLLRWFGNFPKHTYDLKLSAQLFLDLYKAEKNKKSTFFYTEKAIKIGEVRILNVYLFCTSIISEVVSIYDTNNFSLSHHTKDTCRHIYLLAGFRCSGKSYIRELLNKYFDFNVFDTNSVKTYDKDSMTIGPKEIVNRYGCGISYFMFLKEAFLDFFNKTTKSLIIDSIKSYNDYLLIQEYCPNAEIHIIWINANDEVRKKRYINRDINNNIRNSSLYLHDKELIELGIYDIMKNAEFVINSNDQLITILNNLQSYFLSIEG